MFPISRREFGGLVLSATGGSPAAANGIGKTLSAAVSRRKIPAAVAMVATADRTTYSGAFGKRDSASGIDVTAASSRDAKQQPLTEDMIYSIAQTVGLDLDKLKAAMKSDNVTPGSKRNSKFRQLLELDGSTILTSVPRELESISTRPL